MKLRNLLAVSASAMMLALCGCDLGTAAASGSGTGGFIILMVVMFVLMYFLTIRPENKRKKKAEEMRNGVSVGDKITTIGGITGKVVHVTDDKITFETGEDRVRVEIMKWAISSNEGRGANKETSDSQETIGGN